MSYQDEEKYECLRENLGDKLVDYIDHSVVSENILDEMEYHEMELTFDNAKAVWLDFLENLPSQLDISVNRIKERLAREQGEPKLHDYEQSYKDGLKLLYKDVMEDR